jgi:hypothetical protein
MGGTRPARSAAGRPIVNIRCGASDRIRVPARHIGSKIIRVPLLILAWYARLDQKAEDENDDEDENDWGGRKQEKPHSRNHLFTYSLLICYRFSMESLFDYEKLDVYRVELAFIAWIADFLGDVAQSWVLVPVLRFPNRSRRRRRSRLRPLCISKGWSLRLRSSFHGHATPCDAGRAGVHLPSEPVHQT